MSLASLVEKVYFELEELAKIYNSINKRVKVGHDRRVKWKETSDLEALRGFIALCLQNYYAFQRSGKMPF